VGGVSPPQVRPGLQSMVRAQVSPAPRLAGSQTPQLRLVLPGGLLQKSPGRHSVLLWQKVPARD